ncbi:MAG: amidohydrolase family protein [Candidatus Limivicinus sp.]|nr:amidohydrolase family protein [Candidatus Limivicinus sp.]
MYKGHKVLDGHVHYTLDIDPDYFVSLLDKTGTDTANLAVITHGDRVSCTPEALALKDMYPGRFYVFGSLDPCLYYRGGEGMGALMAEYAQSLLAAGCDGIKLLEGKPQLRRALPVPDFDLQCWRAFWDWVERERVPVLWHVNDPENFWDRSSVPVWAARQGWLYDESYINNEEQYRQVLSVVQQHPQIKIVFAHFFFMSAQLPRLEKILSAYPEVMTDLTPGIEMYENFSRTPDETRRFFDRFHDRIIYGTDIGSRFVYNTEGRPFNEKENLRRPEIVRAFVSDTGSETVASDGNFVHDRPDFEMMGLGLDGERLDEVLSGNFQRFVGGEPRPVIPEKALELCRDTRRKLERAAALPGFKPDFAGIEKAEAYFSGKCGR